MDRGSIEDLLRPASLIERKQRLGLLNGSAAPAPSSTNGRSPSPSTTKNLAAGTINHNTAADTSTHTITSSVPTAATESSKCVYYPCYWSTSCKS